MKQWSTTSARDGRRKGSPSRQALVQLIGNQVVRFQEESAAFDDVAARILALDRPDLACMTMLLFGGPASAVPCSRCRRHAARARYLFMSCAGTIPGVFNCIV